MAMFGVAPVTLDLEAFIAATAAGKLQLRLASSKLFITKADYNRYGFELKCHQRWFLTAVISLACWSLLELRIEEAYSVSVLCVAAVTQVKRFWVKTHNRWFIHDKFCVFFHSYKDIFVDHLQYAQLYLLQAAIVCLFSILVEIW